MFYSEDSVVGQYTQYISDAFSNLSDLSRYYLTPPPTKAEDDESEMADRKEILSVSFNQDCSCLAVGHDDGYTFYDIRSIDKLNKIHEGKVPERACIVERLYMSSLITIVSMKSTRKLQVYHSIKENEICCHTYASAILAVRMNRKRVIVCLEDSIHIHNVRDMRLMHMIKDAPLNQHGIMDLSNDESACYLVFPGSVTTGHVHVFDAENLKAMCHFSAHSGPIAALRFNPDGTKLATASDKGTVIRVFGIPSMDRLFEFTRGVKRCVQISSLAFSMNGRYLCLSSNTETVHVFSLLRPEGQQEPIRHEEVGDAGLGAWVNYFSQQATAYLPAHMNELMLREKSTTTARLPIIGSRTVVAMPRINNTDYLLVASADGYLFCYTLATDGGECTLMRQYRIGPSSGGNSGSEGVDDEDNGIPIPLNPRAGSSKTATARTSESEQRSGGSGSGGTKSGSTTPQKITSALSGGRNGSTSSLSQSPPSADLSSNSGAKPVPPPIPPAPKKRLGSSSDKVAPPVPPPPKTLGTNGKVGGNSNPFDVDELMLGGAGDGKSNGGGDDDGLVELVPPADLNDMDEFPPLTHATS